jgi:hypothetical protein
MTLDGIHLERVKEGVVLQLNNDVAPAELTAKKPNAATAVIRVKPRICESILGSCCMNS